VTTLSIFSAQTPRAKPDCLTWAEVHLGALRHNVRTLCDHVGPDVAFMAVVKANAYGHGAVPTAQALLQGGAGMLAVAQLGEAVELREAGIEAPILILGATTAEEARTARHHEVSCIIPSLQWLEEFRDGRTGNAPALGVHLMVDTGMGRVGVWPDEAVEAAQLAAGMPGLELEGVCTHFGTADERDLSHAEGQNRQFKHVLSDLLREGIRPCWVHAANSAATIRMPSAHFNMVRCGLAAYGLRAGAKSRSFEGLQPAMRVVSRVTTVRDLPAGATVSYGRTFTAAEPMRTATVAIGYADGYSRALSGKGVVTLGGEPMPVLGRVTMDQIVVDARRVPDIRAGDTVTIFSDVPGDPNSVEAVAAGLNTIPYEVTCLLTPRVRRIYLDGFASRLAPDPDCEPIIRPIRSQS